MSSSSDLAVAAPQPARPRVTLHELTSVLLTFALCRGALLAFDLLVSHLGPGPSACQPDVAVLGEGWGWLDGFFRWDGVWYLQIARAGYSFDPDQQSSVAYYPLYPYLARYLGFLLGGPAIAGLVLSNWATIVALLYLRRLGALLFDVRVGKLAGVLLLVFPTALFLSVFYTEGLFLALSVACMFYYFRGRLVLAGVLGFFALLTRSTGVALFLALALDLGVRLLRREQRPRLQMLALGLIPFGLLAFMALLQHEVGDALAFAKSLRHWQRGPSWPWQPLVDAFTGAAGPDHAMLSPPHRFIEAVFGSTFLALGTAMAVRRWPIALWSYVVLGVLMPLSSQNIAGMMRYVLVLFPAFLFIAWLCRDRRDLQRIIILASACFLCVYSVSFMRCFWSG